MILYERNVNYSVFDGEITLSKNAKEYFLSTVFFLSGENKDIQLIIDGKKYPARLMNVPSSKSVQISYGVDVQECFKKIFQYSFDYYETGRQEAKRVGISTRKVPMQTLESISVIETEEALVYKVEYEACPYDRENLESEECLEFVEGRAIYKKHLTYERNPGVVRVAKEKFKEEHNGRLYCQICKFSFEDTYGEEYIEAHHTTPVAQLGDNGVTHVEDILMVCANCHRMLHRRGLLTVEELKARMR